MKKVLYWIVLVLGIFLTLGTVIAGLYHTAKIANKMTIGSIPYVLLGMIVDFATNPAGLLGIVLLISASFMRKKMSK